MWPKMTRSHFSFGFLAAVLVCSVSSSVHADDKFVRGAKSLSARAFDKTLPDQSVEVWLRAHLPVGYEAIWGEQITDCGEGTGSPIDAKRDMPLCAEVEVKRGAKIVGYLALMVGTQKRGLLKEGNGLYFGYLEHAGTKYDFRRLSDVLKVN
jgi:hypothetical protein